MCEGGKRSYLRQYRSYLRQQVERLVRSKRKGPRSGERTFFGSLEAKGPRSGERSYARTKIAEAWPCGVMLSFKHDVPAEMPSLWATRTGQRGSGC